MLPLCLLLVLISGFATSVRQEATPTVEGGASSRPAPDQDAAALFRSRALEKLKAGKPQEALAEARRAVESNPEEAESLLVLGTALLAAGEPAEAIPAFERVLKKRPRDPAAMKGLAGALAAVEDPRAGDAYERAIAAAPRDLPLRVEFAESLWRAGERVA